MGFLPEALINYLVRLGWSHGDQEVFSMTELIDLFSFQQVGSSSAALNNEKLLWLNGHYLRHKNAKDLIAPLKNLLLKEGIQDFPETQKLTRMIERTRERCKTLVEMTELMRPYLVKEISYEEQAVKKFLTPEAKPLLEALVRELEKCANWDMMELKSLLNEIAEKNQVKFVKLAQPVRVSLTGSAVSPGIFDVLDLLGKEESLKRLKEGLNQICSS
jgi:glutamyl-tRNA synthetase